MKSKGLALFTVIAIFIVGVVFAMSQESDNQTILLSRLHSDIWQQRAATVEKLIANRNTDRYEVVKNALIDLLDRENHLIESTFRESNGLEGVSVKYGEGYSEYYSVLADAVDQVADYSDQRTLNILIRGSYNPDSPFAMKLASYGEAPVPALLELAHGDFAPHRENALAILGEILKRDHLRIKRIPQEMREEIKLSLVKGTSDEEFWVRSQAVQSIGKAGDKDLIPLLERIMQTDPGAIPAAEPGEKRFPVREEALKAISLIKNEEKRNPM
ncbi:MAG: hypothetical protein V7641_4722 [Blastocatellia bacterium]